MPVFFHLVYVSNAARPLTDADLDDILAVSRRNNAYTGITGALLYSGGNFIQALEGDEAAVRAAFKRIRQDSRHKGVRVVLCEKKTVRLFPDWSMRFKTRPADAEAPTGRWPASSRAQKLLLAFESAFADALG